MSHLNESTKPQDRKHIINCSCQLVLFTAECPAMSHTCVCFGKKQEHCRASAHICVCIADFKAVKGCQSNKHQCVCWRSSFDARYCKSASHTCVCESRKIGVNGRCKLHPIPNNSLLDLILEKTR